MLAPDGDFSDPTGGGWQFFGGARIVDDTRPDGTTGGSLYMPSGSTAVSPVMCVDTTYPTARLWARTLSGDGDVDFAVSYAATKSELHPQSVGHVNGDRRAWKLSGDVHIKPELAGKEAGWRRVAFVLTASAGNVLTPCTYKQRRPWTRLESHPTETSGLTDDVCAPCWSVRRIPTHGRLTPCGN